MSTERACWLYDLAIGGANYLAASDVCLAHYICGCQYVPKCFFWLLSCCDDHEEIRT